jgi:hypothetical protein
VDRSVAAVGDDQTDERGEESDECALRQLARGHHELAVPNLAASYRIALQADVVRRVGERHLSQLPTHQALENHVVQRVPADHAMPSDLPDVAETGNGGLSGRHLRTIVRWVVAGRGRFAIDQQIGLACRETGQLDIEIDLDEFVEMAAQQFKIPNRLLGQAIVRDHYGPLLPVGEPGESYRGNLSVIPRRLAASRRP